jgi:DNA-directed RNA polymerase subunit RPC12/RpoP
MGYLDALKKQGSADIKVANARVSKLLEKQENKCADCKKDLRPGYFKSVVDEKQWKPKIVCSDCLVQLAKRY